MPNVPSVQVESHQELEAAVNAFADRIVVDDEDLAQSIREIKAIPVTELEAALAPSHASGTNSGWNFVLYAFGGALFALFLALGATIILAIAKGYELETSGKASLPGGFGGEGKLVLRRSSAG